MFLENSVDPDHQNDGHWIFSNHAAIVRHAVFNFSTNLTNFMKNIVCPRIGILEFLTVDWEKRYFLPLSMGPYSAPNIGKRGP